MTYFADMAPCSYFGAYQDRLVAIGWLHPDHDYPKGVVAEDFFEALVAMLEHPWQPMAAAGREQCHFCHVPHGPTSFEYRGATVSLGSANLFVPGDEMVFVCPSMIVHYIDSHHYDPPPVFKQAVLAAKGLSSEAYFASLEANGVDPSPEAWLPPSLKRS